MIYRIIRKEELTTAAWSGGTTTQLAIWPPDGSYADRDFTWRVSTARVDAAESEFTGLPGVSRVLMVLNGTLVLEHEGQPAVRIGRFGQDSFDGGVATYSRGRVTDFNLMTRGADGVVEAQYIPASRGMCSEVFYVLAPDQLVVMPNGRAVPLHAGDVIVWQYGRDGSPGIELANFSSADTNIVRARIFHN